MPVLRLALALGACAAAGALVALAILSRPQPFSDDPHPFDAREFDGTLLGR